MSDLKAEYEKLVAGMNPQGYIYRYADGIREGTNGRSINGGYPLETIRYYLAPAIVELLLSERRKVLDRMSTDPHTPTDVLAPLRELQKKWLREKVWAYPADYAMGINKCADELKDLLPALETAIAERVKAAEEAGLRRANKIINDVSTRFQPDFGTLILTAQCEIEEEYQKSGALSRLLAAEREKIIVALYEEQNINAVQLQAAVECIRAFGESRQGPCTAHVEKARDKIRSFTPPLIDLRDKLRLVEARQKESVWWAGTDWNRPIHQSNRLAELDSEVTSLRQQIAELEGKS